MRRQCLVFRVLTEFPVPLDFEFQRISIEPKGAVVGSRSSRGPGPASINRPYGYTSYLLRQTQVMDGGTLFHTRNGFTGQFHEYIVPAIEFPGIVPLHLTASLFFM